MTKKKIIRIGLAVLAAALLAGGAVMLTKDDISQKIKEKELIPYMPAPIILAELDNTVPEVPAEDIQTETEYVKPENIQDFPDITQKTPVSEMPSENVLNELRESVRNIQTVYPDTVGWLYIPDTSINYPIMQGGDNDFYLHHAYDGSSLHAGSIFLDYRCENRFMNPVNIVYGHNMRNGSMFAGLLRFADSAYFDSHRYGWLATPETVYRIDFFSCAKADMNDELYDGSTPVDEWLSHLSDISVVSENADFSGNDRFISLSTCSYEFENARTILTGKLVEMNGG